MKRAGVIVTGVIGWFVAFCSPPFIDTALADEQIFRIANMAEPEYLDPAMITGVVESNIVRNLFEGLCEYDPRDLSPIPGVAERWTISEDGLTYTFHLRKDARWTNGDPVTAHDFVYSWERVLNPATASRYAYQLYYVKNGEAYNKGKIKDPKALGLAAPDDYTFVVTLENPTPFFLHLVLVETLRPVHRATVEKYGREWTRPEHIVSNGPFRLVTWIPQRKIVLKRNERYWDAASVKLEEAHFFPIDDQETALKKYMAGEVDWTRETPNAKTDLLRKNPDFHADPYLGTYFYRLNVTRPPLDDVRVRRALGMSIDKEKITRFVTKAGEQPTDSYTPPGIKGYVPPKGPGFDVKEAQRLLAEAGYPGGAGFPVLELQYNTSENHKRIAQVVQQMWKKNLGIRIALVNLEWQVYLKNQKRLDYDISRSGWIGDYPDPNTFLDLFVTGRGNNNTGWSNPRYDELIALAGREMDPEKRLGYFAEAEKILLEEMPIIPVYIYTRNYMIRPYVKGFYNNLLDIHPLKFVSIEKEQRAQRGR